MGELTAATDCISMGDNIWPAILIVGAMVGVCSAIGYALSIWVYDR